MDIQPEDAGLREAQARRARLRLGLALAVIASTVVLTAIGTVVLFFYADAIAHLIALALSDEPA